tara:strand:- start:638 stop:1579 length:942 start_codon:yes stop_codon:yes gene_type:complete
MSHYYEKFVKGETFKNEDILKILNDNKVKGEIIDIRYHHFKKIFIKIKENEKFFLLKLSLNSHSINLTKNESDGYSFFTKFDKKKFTLPDYQLINLTENYALSRIELIDGKKGNYFEYSKFCINCNQHQIKKVNLNDYIELMWKKYSTKDDKENKLFKMMGIITTKFNNTLIPLEASHGDLIHFNSIKNKNDYFIFDLEFFKQDRAFLYDYLHWHLTPLVNKCAKSKIYSIFFDYTNNLVIKLLKLNIRNKVNIAEKKIFEILLLLFLFERSLMLLQILNLKDFENLVSDYEKNLTRKNYDFTYKLLIKLAKK